jgi:hypothetical protein
VIRQSGRFTDADLLRLAADHDPGFDQATFAEQLGQVATLRPGALAEYGISSEQLALVQQRLLAWRQRILDEAGPTDVETDDYH